MDPLASQQRKTSVRMGGILEKSFPGYWTWRVVLLHIAINHEEWYFSIDFLRMQGCQKVFMPLTPGWWRRRCWRWHRRWRWRSGWCPPPRTSRPPTRPRPSHHDGDNLLIFSRVPILVESNCNCLSKTCHCTRKCPDRECPPSYLFLAGNLNIWNSNHEHTHKK